MNKLLLGVISFGLFVSTSFASEWKLVASSFYWIDRNLRVAEFCGKLQGPAGTDLMKVRMEVEVDPNTSGAGFYMTPTNDKGQFCVVVRSLRGTAKISVYNGSSKMEVSDQEVALVR